jgi:hypothetical protein
MIHILIGLAVATVLIILWASGNLFACVFLSIPPALGLLIIAMRTDPALPIYPQLCFGSLAVIWLPRFLMYRMSVQAMREREPRRPDIDIPPLWFVGVDPYVPKSGPRLTLTDGGGRK